MERSELERVYQEVMDVIWRNADEIADDLAEDVQWCHDYVVEEIGAHAAYIAGGVQQAIAEHVIGEKFPHAKPGLDKIERDIREAFPPTD